MDYEDDEGREVKVDKPFLIVEKSVPQKVSVSNIGTHQDALKEFRLH